MSPYNNLKLEYPLEHVALMTFNRPDRLNAISREMIEEFHDLLTRMEGEKSTRVLIITGAGRGFCSGTDLKAGKDAWTNEYNVSLQMRNQRRLADLPLHMRKIPQPIIGAINGVAAGGGFSFAMACDIRIAAKSARFICPFVNIGISAGEMGSSYFLPRLVGISRASEILYTGREVGSEEAERIGLVSRIVDDGAAVEQALELARVLTQKGPFAIKMTKELLNHSVDAPNAEAQIFLENRTQALCVNTDDFREALKAFSEKRPPCFKDD